VELDAGCLFALATLIPAYSHFAPRISRTVEYRFGDEVAKSSARLPVTWTNYAFARTVRDVTPETAGFLDEKQTPEYGVLVQPEHGHLFTYVARRPVPANNLGPYLDRGLHQRAAFFYEAQQADVALDLLEALQVRYFVTSLGRLQTESFALAVHFSNDSSARNQDRSSTGRIRLVAEGPPRGRPTRTWGPPGERVVVPTFKLFEVVEGAVLVAETEPNALATARLPLASPLGRTPFRVDAQADASGWLQLRVPYPSESPDAQQPMVHALGKWRVEVGGNRYAVTVTEADVREGHEIRLDRGGSARRESR